MPMVSVDVGYVDVDVELEDFNDDDLITELEARGYSVISADESNSGIFTREETNLIQHIIDSLNPRIGSLEWSIREKLVPR